MSLSEDATVIRGNAVKGKNVIELRKDATVHTRQIYKVESEAERNLSLEYFALEK